jgi:hypothetical protein
MSNRRQPQRIPPPITHGAEPIDSAILLREFPGVLGLALWKTVRTVRLWAELPETERGRAFVRGSQAARLRMLESPEIPREVQVLLARCAGVLRPRARSATVGGACRGVAGWAESGGAAGTAVEFLQAAAIAQPAEAELAYEVGRAARARGENQRAETWFRQAISRARRSQNRYEFSRSYVALGSVHLARGNHQQAKRGLIRGLRAAKRFSIRPLAATAYHQLAVLAIRANRPAEVGRYARAAIEAYGPGHSELPSLASEVGAFLLDAGYGAEARRIFESLPADPSSECERLRRLAGIARAAALTGDCSAYASAWDAAEAMIADGMEVAGAPSDLLSLARSAAVVEHTDRAVRAATMARDRATSAGEDEIAQEATRLLDAISAGDSFERPSSKPGSPKVVGLVRAIETALA